MKEASGELNMTVVTIVAIAAVLALFWVLWNGPLRDTITNTWNNIDTEDYTVPGFINPDDLKIIVPSK